MNITYTWVVTAFERLKQQDSLTNVVTRVLGNLVAHDSDSDTYSRQPFAVKVDGAPVDPDTFVSFEQIDEALVLQWIQQAWGDERIQQEKDLLVEEIEHQLNFEVVDPPWSSE